MSRPSQGLSSPISLIFAICLLAESSILAQTDPVIWRSLGPFEPCGEVRSLTIDPTAPATIYAGTAKCGVQKTTDAGATWTAANEGLGLPFVTALAMDLLSPPILYAGAGPLPPWNPIPPLVGGTFRTVNGGRGWSRVLNQIPDALAVDPSLPSVAYAGGNFGVFRTLNGGVTWTPANNGLPTNELSSPAGIGSLATDPKSPGTLYAAGGGIFRSTDYADSWVPIRRAQYEGIRAIAAHPGPPTTLYAISFYAGPAPTLPPSGSILKSSDGGANWIPANTGLERAAVFSVAVDPTLGSIVYAGAIGSVFRSANSGASWEHIGAGLPRARISALAIDPRNPEVVYAATEGFGVFRTESARADGCTPGSAALCLSDGRFLVEVNWHAHSSGARGVGRAVPLTPDTGAFWFFDSANLELMVKVLDGRPINGRFWAFLGSLTNVEFTVTVMDSDTGATKTYVNPQGRLASVADVEAF